MNTNPYNLFIIFIRQNDIEKFYENCEIIKPQSDIYPLDLGGITSTYASDFPEEFLSDLNANANGNLIKIVLSNNEKYFAYFFQRIDFHLYFNNVVVPRKDLEKKISPPLSKGEN